MFKNVLREVVDNTEGAIASLLMGFDGITVDAYHLGEAPQPNIETVGMEYTAVLSQIRQAAEMLDIGACREVAVQTEGMTTIIRLINDDYFAAVTLRPGGNYGKARFQLRVKAPDLLNSLA